MRKSLFAAIALVVFPLAVGAIPKTDATYVAVKSDAENQKLIDAGIEGAVEDMSFITRPIARKKLGNTNIASKQISVKMSGKKLTIQHDDRAEVSSKPDGKSFTWKREDGEPFQVSQAATDDTVTQVYAADDGKKTMTYKFSEDMKKMTLDVKVESPKLAAPLEYSILYAKK